MAAIPIGCPFFLREAPGRKPGASRRTPALGTGSACRAERQAHTAPAERAREAIQARPGAAIGPEARQRDADLKGLQPLSTPPACGQVVQYAFPGLPGYGASAAPWLPASMPEAPPGGIGRGSGRRRGTGSCRASRRTPALVRSNDCGAERQARSTRGRGARAFPVPPRIGDRARGGPGAGSSRACTVDERDKYPDIGYSRPGQARGKAPHGRRLLGRVRAVLEQGESLASHASSRKIIRR